MGLLDAGRISKGISPGQSSGKKERRSLISATPEQVSQWGAGYDEKLSGLVEEAIGQRRESLRSLSYDDRQDAEQKTRISAWLHSSDMQAEARAYIRMITDNAVKDSLRHRRRQREHSIENAPTYHSDDDDGVISPSPLDSVEDTSAEGNPAAHAEEKELREKLKKALNSLPAKKPSGTLMMEVVQLKGKYGLTFAEIAKVLNISEGTAKACFYRALPVLKKILSEEGISQEDL